MDHRCGSRHALDIPVRYYLPTTGWSTAPVRDVSMSGLFLAGVYLPPRLVITIELPALPGVPARARRLACRAMVVRVEEGGVGLVFDEFGPAPVRGLLADPAASAPSLAA